MEKQINREYLNKVRDYIRNDKATYTFEKFFKDNNLLADSIMREVIGINTIYIKQ